MMLFSSFHNLELIFIIFLSSITLNQSLSQETASTSRYVEGLDQTHRVAFLSSLSHQDTLNDSNDERTNLLLKLIEKKRVISLENFPGKNDEDDSELGKYVSVAKPASWPSMTAIAPGTWKVIYAPHLAFGASILGGGDLDVQYILEKDGTISSHATWRKFPWMSNNQQSIFLSVSGRYDSVSDNICEVIWDHAWVKLVEKGASEDGPFQRLSDVPNSPSKAVIDSLGKLFFIKPFSVFPVSFLSTDLCVFDFELLGTRICAKKILQ